MIRLKLNLIAVAAALAGAAPALAAPPPATPAVTSICLDVGGQTLPVVCHMPASRLDRRDQICQCPEGMRIDAPVCGPKERPPAENVAYDRARRLAGQDGTLVGDLYQGKPMCVDLSGR